jgi:hypothetical protein
MQTQFHMKQRCETRLVHNKIYNEIKFRGRKETKIRNYSRQLVLFKNFRSCCILCKNSIILKNFSRVGSARKCNGGRASVCQIFRYFSIFFRGAAAQRGPWPPHSRSFLITHNDAPQSVGLLWTSDQLVAGTST